MSIPGNITKEHLIKAIEKIDAEGIPKDGDSKYYDVVFEGKNYPPKVIVSYANYFANGIELNRNSFEGGKNTKCFKLLEKNGFQIQKKASTAPGYYGELIRFLNDSISGNLRTADYQKSFLDLKVKVSFGQGNQARVPWIAFLNGIDDVQEGIYPVYLNYKDKNLLILAYGVSETRPSPREWSINDVQTVSEYFNKNDLGKPERYGSSFVFRTYDTSSIVSEEDVDSDLNEIISIYKQTSFQSSILKSSGVVFNHGEFYSNAIDAGYFLDKKLCTRFCASLLTKPFVILTGLAGSGKTKLAQAFVQWICKKKEQYCIVPVGADWTNREPLLGFSNSLQPEKYVLPENDALKVVMRANQHPKEPHFLILDEMNLSHVERYFADFLSVMESKENIKLHQNETSENGVPGKLKWPSNLFIIGTVNIDETTNMFSPKVLDRANTIEFRVTQEEMKSFLQSIKSIDMDALTGKGADMALSFVEMASQKNFSIEDQDYIHESLVRFFGELKKIGAEFGYRSASEIIGLIHHLSVLDETLSINQRIDISIMQKLLPKLHGSRRKLCPVLETLGSFCINSEIKIAHDVFDNADFDFEMESVLFPLSLEKIKRMYKGAIDNGFASYAEA